MLWLPNPQAHEQPIAVSDRSALALERALLVEDIATAAHQLREAMLGDGWLISWMQAWHSGPPLSVDHLAVAWAEEPLRSAESLADNAEMPAWSRPDDAWAQSIASAAVMAPRVIDPAHCCEWRLHSPDFVARVIQTLRDSPHHQWLDAGDAEYQEYLEVDPWIGWRLPRVARQTQVVRQARAELDKRLQSAKLDAMKELAYGASHEINNPLANISGRAQILLKDEADPRRRRLLAAIDGQALRAHEMISDLMFFARPPHVEKRLTQLAPLVAQVAAELETQFADRKVELEFVEKSTELAIDVDTMQFLVALRALIENSLDAVGSGGRIRVELDESEGGEGTRYVEVVVADTGQGIAEPIRPHIWDPFFSGREAGRGLGFGLSKVWRVVTDHGGDVDVMDYPGFATAFCIRFPRNRESTVQ